jgi:hypothetical protein
MLRGWLYMDSVYDDMTDSEVTPEEEENFFIIK